MIPNILVVEDDEALEALLAYNLEKEGYKISVARDGEEALLLVAEGQPDLIILDWMIPKVPGIEVCRRLRARNETKNIPINPPITDKIIASNKNWNNINLFFAPNAF